jgi:hypothetical protein
MHDVGQLVELLWSICCRLWQQVQFADTSAQRPARCHWLMLVTHMQCTSQHSSTVSRVQLAGTAAWEAG